MLETERLILRRFEMKDADDLFEYAKDSNVALKAGFPPHPNVEFTKEFLQKYFIPNPDIFAIELKDTHKVIGSIEVRNAHKKGSFEDLNLKENTHEIGATLNSHYWSNGYMTEAMNKIMEYAFYDLNSEGIYATTSSKNFSSQALQTKTGLNFIDSIPREKKWVDGSENDTQRRGITREEYLLKHKVK